MATSDAKARHNGAMLDSLTARQRELWDLADRFQKLPKLRLGASADNEGETLQGPEQSGVGCRAQPPANDDVIDLAEWVGSIHGSWLHKTLDGPTLAQLRASKRRAAKMSDDAADSKPAGH